MLSSKLLTITFACSCSALRLPVNLPQSTSESESTATTEGELPAPTTSTVQLGFENYNFQLNVGNLHPSFAKRKDSVASDVAPQILLTHLLKAGGSSVAKMMKELMFTAPRYSHQSFKGDIETDQGLNYTGLEKDGPALNAHSQYFRIGMVRSPCDYLVSIWNFQSSPYGPDGTETGHGAWPRECLQKYYKGDISELYARKEKQQFMNTLAQKDRFQKWVREVGGEKMHYLTYRSYVALHMDPKYWGPQSHIKAWDDGQYYTCIKDHSASEQNDIQKTLMTSDFSQRYECMIKTETMATDMKACMHKFAERITHPEVKAKFVQKIESYQRFNQKQNSKPHGKCNDYFDDETMAFVWDREGPFAKKMGYNTCCSA